MFKKPLAEFLLLSVVGWFQIMEWNFVRLELLGLQNLMGRRRGLRGMFVSFEMLLKDVLPPESVRAPSTVVSRSSYKDSLP